MLTEACATRKPVYIFDLHTGPGNRWGLLERLIGRFPPLLVPAAGGCAFSRSFSGSRSVLGPTRMTRDVRIIHRQLQAQGRAVWLGEHFPAGLRRCRSTMSPAPSSGSGRCSRSRAGCGDGPARERRGRAAGACHGVLDDPPARWPLTPGSGSKVEFLVRPPPNQ